MSSADLVQANAASPLCLKICVGQDLRSFRYMPPRRFCNATGQLVYPKRAVCEFHPDGWFILTVGVFQSDVR